MKIGIIGGGASGMTAAISAARLGGEVTILEGGDRVGKKILATGNGKCNFTNRKMDSICFRSNTMADISPFLEAFGMQETLAFFSSLHMLFKEKNGYFYPASEQAGTVLDVLRYELERYGEKVRILTNKKARAITYQKDKQVTVLCGTERFCFDRVILACGSKASPKTGSDGSGYQLLRSLKCGCDIEEVVPALVQLRCQEEYLKAVAGVRIEGCVSLFIDEKAVCMEQGELQLTDYGISGIPVFQLSRFASYGCLHGSNVRVQLDLVPAMNGQEFTEFMTKRREQMKSCTMEHLCAGLLNKKVCALFAKLAGISMQQRVCDISDQAYHRFTHLFKHWALQVDRPNGFDMAQICAGGLSMQEINTHFAMKKCSSVYVVGELLDVDGICGGYNLQWAWTSGYLAGRYAVSDGE